MEVGGGCFSPASAAKLATCHPDLQRLFNAVVKQRYCVVTCGHRGEADQHAAVEAGTSLDPWPTSRHNSDPAEAVDVVPYPVSWTNLQAFRDLAVIVKAMAVELGIAVEWGGDFKHLVDMPHWQLPLKQACG